MNKPKFKTIQCINLLDILEYGEEYCEGLKDRVWEHLMKYETFGNDRIINFNLNYFYNCGNLTEEQLQLRYDFRLLANLLNIDLEQGGNIYMEVMW